MQTMKLNQKNYSWTTLPFLVRFGSFTLHNHSIKEYIGIFLILLWKVQILALILHVAVEMLHNDNSLLKDVAESISNFFILGRALDLKNSNITASLIWYVAQIYSFYTCGCFISTGLAILENSDVMKTSCKVKFGREAYYHQYFFAIPIIDLNLLVIDKFHSDDLYAICGTPMVTVILSYLSIAWMLLSAGVFLGFFWTPIQMLEPLSAKTKFGWNIEFMMRYVVYLFTIVLKSGQGKEWVIMVVVLLSFGLRDWNFFKTIPLYNIKILKIDAFCNGLTTLLGIVNFVALAIKDSSYHVGINTSLMTWALLAPVFSQFYLRTTQTLLFEILKKPHAITKPAYLMHRIAIYEHFRSKRELTYALSDTMNFYDLYLTGKEKTIKVHTREDGSQIPFNFSNQQHFDSFAVCFLNECVKTHPESWKLKATYIERLIVYKKAYLKALALIEERIRLTTSFAEKICYSLILQQFEYILIESDQNSSGLKMVEYIQAHDNFDRIKERINKQADLHLKFWQEYTNPEINFKNLVNFSNQSKARHNRIIQGWVKFTSHHINFPPKFYLEMATYQCLVNNGYSCSSRLIRQYFKAYEGSIARAKHEKLNNLTMYDPSSGRIAISGRKEDLGTIVYACNQVKNMLGYTGVLLEGQNVKVIAPGVIRQQHDDMLKYNYQTGNTHVTDRTRKVLAITKDGFLLPIYLHIKVNPYIKEGIQYFSILRPTEKGLNFIMLTHNGHLEAATYSIANELYIENLKKRELRHLHITELCSEFDLILKVFNFIAKKALKNSKCCGTVGHIDETDRFTHSKHYSKMSSSTSAAMNSANNNNTSLSKESSNGGSPYMMSSQNYKFDKVMKADLKYSQQQDTATRDDQSEPLSSARALMTSERMNYFPSNNNNDSMTNISQQPSSYRYESQSPDPQPSMLDLPVAEFKGIEEEYIVHNKLKFYQSDIEKLYAKYSFEGGSLIFKPFARGCTSPSMNSVQDSHIICNFRVENQITYGKWNVVIVITSVEKEDENHQCVLPGMYNAETNRLIEQKKQQRRCQVRDTDSPGLGLRRERKKQSQLTYFADTPKSIRMSGRDLHRLNKYKDAQEGASEQSDFHKKKMIIQKLQQQERLGLTDPSEGNLNVEPRMSRFSQNFDTETIEELSVEKEMPQSGQSQSQNETQNNTLSVDESQQAEGGIAYDQWEQILGQTLDLRNTQPKKENSQHDEEVKAENTSKASRRSTLTNNQNNFLHHNTSSPKRVQSQTSENRLSTEGYIHTTRALMDTSFNPNYVSPQISDTKIEESLQEQNNELKASTLVPSYREKVNSVLGSLTSHDEGEIVEFNSSDEDDDSGQIPQDPQIKKVEVTKSFHSNGGNNYNLSPLELELQHEHEIFQQNRQKKIHNIPKITITHDQDDSSPFNQNRMQQYDDDNNNGDNNRISPNKFEKYYKCPLKETPRDDPQDCEDNLSCIANNPFSFSDQTNNNLHMKVQEEAKTILSRKINSNMQHILTKIEQARDSKYQDVKHTIFGCTFTTMVIAVTLILLAQSIVFVVEYGKMPEHIKLFRDNTNFISSQVELSVWLRSGASAVEGFTNRTGTSLTSLLKEAFLTCERAMTRLTESDQPLQLGLIEIMPKEKTMIAFERNVRFYDVDANGDSTGVFNNLTVFQVVDFFTDLYNRLSHLTPANRWQSVEIKTILFNLLNDQLVYCKKIFDLIHLDIIDALDGEKSILLLATILNISLLTLFSIGTLIIILHGNHISDQFASTFCHISDSDANNLKQLLQKFLKVINQRSYSDQALLNIKGSEEKKSMDQLLQQERNDISLSNTIIPTQNAPNTPLRTRSRQNTSRTFGRHKPFTTNSYKIRNLCLALRIIPLLIFNTSLFILYKEVSIASLDLIRQSEYQIMKTGKMKYEGVLVLAALQEIPVKNATTFINNKPILEEVLNLISSIEDVESFANLYRRDNKEFYAGKTQFLTNMECNRTNLQIFETSLSWSDICHNISDGRNSIGLVDIYTETAKLGRDFVALFERSPRTQSNLKDLTVSIVNDLQYHSFAIPILSRLLLDEVEKGFRDEISKQQRVTIIFVSIFEVIMLVIMLIGWFFVLRRIRNKGNELKSMLKMLPLSLIIRNRYIKGYLFKASHDVMKPIMKMLS